MRISTASTLAALAATVSAFADTAPFIVFGSEDVSKSFSGFGDLKKPIVQANDLPTFNCPTVDHVLILTHHGANVDDFHRPGLTPLKSAIKSAKYKLEVPEYVGEYDHKTLWRKMWKECGYEGLKVEESDEFANWAIDLPEDTKTVLRVNLASLGPLSSTQRNVEVEWKQRELRTAQSDTALHLTLPSYTDKSYMVIYVGIPMYYEPLPLKSLPSQPSESSKPSKLNEHAQAAHDANTLRVQSRRDSGISEDKKNSTITDHRPLFEKYQFFTPGLFMGLLVTLLLLSILFVALRAISSLEVSYAAFEKEMGPQKNKAQ